jgi:hypothetical protein
MHKPRNRIVYDYMCDNVANQKITNQYIVKFAREPMIRQYRLKKFQEWRSLLNKNSLKKEITECYAVSDLLTNDILPKLKQLEQYKTIVFFDMCSGKGYNSIVLYANLPEHLKDKSQLIMLDKDTSMNLSHLDTLEQIKFHHFCIHTEKKGGTEKLSNDLLNHLKKFGEPGKDVVGIMIGVHLCVHLSEIFINVFNSLDCMVAMTLSPCCMYENDSNRDIYEMFQTSIYEECGMKSELFNYFLWTHYLYRKVDPELTEKRVTNDENVLSEKNNYIVAYKKAAA